MSGLMKAGVAKKVYNEARKPQNQRKAKELFNKVANKGGSAGGNRGRR